MFETSRRIASRTILAAPLLISMSLAGSLYSTGAHAAGESNTTVTPSCSGKKIWDTQKKKCVKAKKSSSLDDDNLYEAARDLAYNKRYDEALDVLALASNQNDPRILNYKGFATRKLGRVEEGLVYYRAALKVDPNYTLVREYMGEAFLQLGQVDKAREQLAAIGSICGTDCREYVMLEKAITTYGAAKS